MKAAQCLANCFVKLTLLSCSFVNVKFYQQHWNCSHLNIITNTELKSKYFNYPQTNNSLKVLLNVYLRAAGASDIGQNQL